MACYIIISRAPTINVAAECADIGHLCAKHVLRGHNSGTWYSIVQVEQHTAHV